jgi:hypothetical protein
VLYQVDIGYACFGVEVKHKKDVKLWIENKAGTIQRCANETP